MTEKEEAYKIISELVERFSEQLESYKKATYNETLTRRDFIDPFFKALGWDMDNSQGYAESYREVIHEDKVKIGGATKAPDYSFRLVGGRRLFFVEAKKPSVVVKDDTSVAYQIRRYGWSAKLAISVVTDFEEFAVYDCTKKPHLTDKAATARIKYFTFRDYLKEFDFIWETFSKTRILKGGLDKFVQSDTQKKGTATVDREFLESLDNWRKYLATSIALNNKQLREDEINYAVQQTIDRIIFLRIAEDRSIEPYGTMKVAIKQGNYYQNLFQLFHEADAKYNSGLFDFKKDHICESLKIDNKVVKTIINELYYPESPYEFSVLSVEILGSAYEQFLGKVIRITPAHNAVIEEKSEVRKAGGVFYTPQYVVDYIVKHTVGKLIEGKTPEEISKLKIVDPACGSGSFLLGAYQYLIDYHKDYYSENGKPNKGKKGNPLTPDGNLTTTLKKTILLNNIYGVDLDVNAVEVTKLSLLLKCLEGETQASIEQQLQLFKERVLPDLDNNIKSGNSLIDTDFYDGQFEFDEERKIKPFNWHKAFPEVFKIKKPDIKLEFKKQYNKVKNLADETEELINRLSNKAEEPRIEYVASAGFDVVIGNPPWVDLKGHAPELVNYYFNKFQTTENRINLYAIFVEKGLQLLNSKGKFGFIIPNSLLYQSSYEKLRKLILQKWNIENIVRLPDNVFQNVKAETLIITISKEIGQTECIIYDRKDVIAKIEHENAKDINYLDAYQFCLNEFCAFDIFTNDNRKKILEKIALENTELQHLCDFSLGITPYDKYKGHSKKQIEERVFHSEKKMDKTFKPVLQGSDVSRYYIKWGGKEYISYGEWLGAPREKRFFTSPRILIRQIVSGNPQRIYAGYTEEELYNTQSIFNLVIKNGVEVNLKYILAILNSNLMNFYHGNKFLDLSKNLFQKILIQNCKKFPIRIIDPKNNSDIILYNEIVKFVDHLLQLYKEKQNVILQSAHEQLKGKIEYCEEKLNQMIYELYGLTQDEINIIEEK